jgi:hypothetical protein
MQNNGHDGDELSSRNCYTVPLLGSINASTSDAKSQSMCQASINNISNQVQTAHKSAWLPTKNFVRPYRLQKVTLITKALLGQVFLPNYSIYCHMILLSHQFSIMIKSI